MTSLQRKTTPPEREQRRGRPSQKTDLSRLKAPHPQPTTRTFTPPARTHPATTTGDRSLPPSWRSAIHSKIQSGRMYQVQIAEIKIHRECARSHGEKGGSQPGAISCRNSLSRAAFLLRRCFAIQRRGKQPTFSYQLYLARGTARAFTLTR
jgi:hypothetical protein